AAHADTGRPSRRRSQPPPAMPAARVPPRASPEARSPASTGRPSRPRLAGELDAPAATARNAGAAPAHQQTTPASEGPVRFRLALLRCGPLAVLNQLPLLGSERLGGAQRRLFLNLMNALGLPAGQASIPEDSF